MINKFRSIAIDGPSGAGKSTISKFIAQELGFIYVDTGALYRAVGLYVYRAGIDSEDVSGIIGVLGEISLSIDYGEDGTQHVFLNGEDVSKDIRLPEMSIYASNVSKIPEVRSFLLDIQRDMAKHHDIIMDGRDIGTVILPDADLKIFLTASEEDRAMRRYEELIQKGIDTTYDEVMSDLIFRDRNDSTRETAPLAAASDAVTVVTTGNTLEKSCSVLLNLVKEHFGL